MKNGSESRVLLQALMAALTVAASYVCWPLWPSLVLAAWTATLARPLLVRFERRLKGRRRAASALSLLLFAVLALPVAALVLGVLAGAQDLARLLAQQPSAKGVLRFITSDPAAPGLGLPGDLAGAMELLERHGARGVQLLEGVAGAASTTVIALFIYFAGAYAFLVHNAEVWDWMQRHSPLSLPRLERFAAAFHETGHGLLVGVGLTSATQGLIATLVYLSFGVPRWWVLGPVTGLASMLPVIGSALVWAPLAIGFFLGDHAIKGTILVLLGAGIISTADNVLRPLYAHAGSLKMPTFLLFVALFGGLAAFGTWGAILGPLIIRLWLEALALEREAAIEPASQ